MQSCMVDGLLMLFGQDLAVTQERAEMRDI